MFDNLTFTETLEIVDAYHSLAKAIGHNYTQWEIAEFIDDDHEYKTMILAEWSDATYVTIGTDIDRANVKYWAEYGSIVHVEDDDNAGKAWIEMGDYSGVGNLSELLDILSDITQTIHAVNDYPLIDDQIHSDMLTNDAAKAWDDYIAADIIYALKAQFHDAQEWCDAHENKLRGFYYEFEGNEWTFETPTTVINFNHDKALDYAVRKIMVSR